MIVWRQPLFALVISAFLVLIGTLPGWQAAPVAAATDAAGVSAGLEHTCAWTTAGEVRCWGANGSGELGDGTSADSTTPVTVCADASCGAALSGVTYASTRASHTCALVSGGGVVCWGANDFGQLGNGTSIDSTTPVAVCADATCAAPLSGAAAIATGSFHACALTSGGGVACWGANDFGQLGDGTSTDSSTPVTVCADATCATPLSGVAAISAGEAHTCALTTAGQVKCWGDNARGQLGDGTTTSTSTPVDVCADASCTTALTGVAAVAAGFIHTCALTTAGDVSCWGFNGSGGLGDGTFTDRTTPVAVCADATCSASLSGVAGVSAGGAHTCAVSTAGSVKCWGLNFFAKLGDNTTTDSPTPVDVCADATCSSSLAGVAAVSAGAFHTCALDTSGGVKCWGFNGGGKLGDGTTADQPVPVDVVGLGAQKDLPPPGAPPAVGGVSVDPELDALPAQRAPSTGPGLVAGIATALAAGAVALGGGVWYARRRRAGR